MITLMSTRARVMFDTTDVMRRAVKIYAGKYDLSLSDVIHRALELLCPEEIKQAKEVIAAEEKAKKHKG